APNAMRATLDGQPVERAARLPDNLRESCFGSQGVARQRRGPPPREHALHETGKAFATSCLPVAAMDPYEARSPGVIGWKQVPLVALTGPIGEVEVLWSTSAKRRRGRDPALDDTLRALANGGR